MRKWCILHALIILLCLFCGRLLAAVTILVGGFDIHSTLQPVLDPQSKAEGESRSAKKIKTSNALYSMDLSFSPRQASDVSNAVHSSRIYRTHYYIRQIWQKKVGPSY